MKILERLPMRLAAHATSYKWYCGCTLCAGIDLVQYEK